MPMDAQLLARWNAYPRCIYHTRRGFIVQATGRPFKGAVSPVDDDGEGRSHTLYLYRK